MDPLPPPPPDQQDQTPARPPWWWGVVYPLALFMVSMTVNVCQRERHADELRQQGKELQEIKAMLAERRERRE